MDSFHVAVAHEGIVERFPFGLISVICFRFLLVRDELVLVLVEPADACSS